MKKYIIKTRINQHHYALNDLYEKYKQNPTTKLNVEIVAEISCIRRMKKLMKKYK